MFKAMVFPSREWRIAYACLVLRALNTIGPGLAGTALIRLFELTVCRSYYRQFDASAININDMVPEMKCKVAGVQSQMSNLSSIETLVSLIPIMIGALPYLIWSRIMNKNFLLLVYFVGFLGGILSYTAILYFYNTFNIRLIWLVNLFSLIGGGHIVFRSLVSSIAAEALPKASLTAYYLYSSAILLAVDVLSSAAGLYLMKTDPWSAVVLGVGFHMLSVPVLSFLDDGKPLRTLQPQDKGSRTISKRTFWSEATDIRKQGSKLLVSARNSSLYILIFLTHKCGSSVYSLIPQWMSKRYERPLREIGFIELGQQIWITVILVAIPILQRSLASHLSSSKSVVSAKLVKGSVACSMIGTMLLSLSWSISPAIVSLAISAAGSGFYDILLGLVTEQTDKADLVQVYMCISIVEDLGGRLAGTIIFAIYGMVIKMDNFVGMALPLWICISFYIGSMLLTRRL